MDSRTNGAGQDRWSFKPPLASLAVVFTLALLCGLPGKVSFILIPLSLLCYGIACIAIPAVAVYLIVKKRPRVAASVFLALLLPALLWSPINWVADLAHLGLTTEFGIGQLGGTAKSTGSGFEIYDWSVGLAGGPNTFLIHDVTDEIALPADQRKQPPTSENGLGELCGGHVRRLVSHYYICVF